MFPRKLVVTYKPTPCQNPWDNDLKNTCHENPKLTSLPLPAAGTFIYLLQMSAMESLSYNQAKTTRENFPVVQRPSNSGINSKHDAAERTPSGEFSTHLDTRPCIPSIYDFTEGLRAKVKCTSTWHTHKTPHFLNRCIWHIWWQA